MKNGTFTYNSRTSDSGVRLSCCTKKEIHVKYPNQKSLLKNLKENIDQICLLTPFTIFLNSFGKAKPISTRPNMKTHKLIMAILTAPNLIIEFIIGTCIFSFTNKVATVDNEIQIQIYK